MKTINYSNISSVKALRRQRREVSKEIRRTGKKIRNDYSVFVSSFTVISLAGIALRKVRTLFRRRA